MTPDPSPAPLPAADWLPAAMHRVEHLLRVAAENVIDAGLELVRIKAALPHGRWLDWVENTLGISDQTARNMRLAAEQLGAEKQNYLGFTPTALYQLAQPSTPPEVRAKAVEMAAAARDRGEAHKLTPKDLRAIFTATRPEPPADAAPRPTPSTSAACRAGTALDVLTGRTCRVDIQPARDPDDDLLVSVSVTTPDGLALRDSGRDLADLLEALVSRLDALAPLAIDPAPHERWAAGIGRAIAVDTHGFKPGSDEAAELERVAVAELVKAAGRFDPARVPEGGDEAGAFRGYAHPSVKKECHRAAKRLTNGGLYNTARVQPVLHAVPLPASVG
jgi:hypothetical protein